MQKRRLGERDPQVSASGPGCMGMSEFYAARDDRESVSTLHRALDLGSNLLDTADIYGPYTNEELVGRAIHKRRDEVFLATKFGIVREGNVGTLDGTLSADELAGIEAVFPRGAAAGARYTAPMMALLNG